MNYNFSAPEEIELAIVNYGYEVLNLKLGDFWYKWFRSANILNGTLHLLTNEKFEISFLNRTILELSELNLEKIFKIQFIELPDYEEFRYMYYIHFKERGK